MKICLLGSVAMVIGFAFIQLSNGQSQELRGNHICTKIIKYETTEAYYERQRCEPKAEPASLLNTKHKCNPKDKYIILKKYRKIYRYKKVYVCCPGYVRVWYKCVKAKTTQRSTTPTATPASVTTMATSTMNVTTEPTTTTNVTSTPNMTTIHMPTNDKCLPVIVIVLIVITLVVVILSGVLCIVCCCRLLERKKKCRCYGKDVSEKVPITKGSATEKERTYNHYDSCVLPVNKNHHDNNVYPQQSASNYEDLHRYDNTKNGQIENTYSARKY